MPAFYQQGYNRDYKQLTGGRDLDHRGIIQTAVRQ
jgi:hypothetical protein